MTPIEAFARWMPLDRLRCPADHGIDRHALVMPAGAHQCQHRDSNRGPRCGRWVYIVACRAANIAYVVPTTWAKLGPLVAGDMPPMEVLELLLSGTALFPGAQAAATPNAASA